jgi:predicted Mrr-cat superfamily restriction endonuclease
MAFWSVRAGSGGEQEQFALENDCVVVGWDDVPDLLSFPGREALKRGVAKAYPDAKDKTLVVWVGNLGLLLGKSR